MNNLKKMRLLISKNNKFKPRSANKNQIPILMYHNIVPKPELDKIGYSISPKRFKSHMKVLRESGYNPISLEELDEHIYEKSDLPEKSILITFDDGKANNYRYLFPILKELNIKGNIFLIGEEVEKENNKDFLSWNEIMEMKRSGLLSFGSHTYGFHHKLNGKAAILLKKKEESETEYLLRIEKDFMSSKALLEKNLGSEVFSIAYPYGEYTKEIDEISKKVGYRESFTTVMGFAKTDKTGFLLKRINVDGLCSSRRLIYLIESLKHMENIKAKFTNE